MMKVARQVGSFIGRLFTAPTGCWVDPNGVWTFDLDGEVVHWDSHS